MGEERQGTPSGLLNQQHAVYDRGVLDWWEQNLEGVHIVSGEWNTAVALMPTPDTQSSYYFFDPPYRDSFADYGNSFNDTALHRLVAYANTRSCVLLSNRESDDGWFEEHRGEPFARENPRHLHRRAKEEDLQWVRREEGY